MDIQEVGDRLAIRELMDRYGMACDSRDWNMYRSLFTANAVIDYSEFGGGRGGLDSTLEWLNAGLAPFIGLHHNMTNHICEISGSTAKAITYFIAYQSLPNDAGGEFIMEVGGFYKDRLVKARGRWLISERNDLGMWLKAPWPEALKPPIWYGTRNHHTPTLLED
jgi:hypothetical protein